MNTSLPRIEFGKFNCYQAYKIFELQQALLRYRRTVKDIVSVLENLSLTQEDLLKRLGLNKETYRQAKSLTNLSPEIQQLIEQGNISPSTAARLVAKLSPKEQEALIANLPATQKYTQSQVQSYIDQPKQANNRQRQIHTVKKSVMQAEK